MGGLQKPGRVAGLWFIGTFVFSIPAVLLYDPVLNDASFVLGKGLDARISLGALFEVLLAVGNIATAVVFFFPVLSVRRVSMLQWMATSWSRSSWGRPWSATAVT
jgi:hypothetical protein